MKKNNPKKIIYLKIGILNFKLCLPQIECSIIKARTIESDNTKDKPIIQFL